MTQPGLTEINRAMDIVQADMPEIGPDLFVDSEVVQLSLQEELGLPPLSSRIKHCIYGMTYDVTGPEAETAILMNKAERYVLLRYFMEKQHDHLVTGERREARFMQSIQPSSQGPREAFDTAISRLYSTARDKVVFDTPWFAEASNRYRRLGLLPSILANDIMGIYLGDAIRDLDFSLEGGGMHTTIPELAFLLRKHPEVIPSQERLKAAHDLSHLALRRASHGFEVNMPTQGLETLQGDIVKLGEPPLYVYRPTPAQKPDESIADYERRCSKASASHNIVFAQGIISETVALMYDDFLPPTLKCPSHHSTSQRKISPLNHQVHASIELGGQLGLFSNFR